MFWYIANDNNINENKINKLYNDNNDICHRLELYLHW